MKLPFDADQATYDAWHAHHMNRVTDSNDPMMFVDLNDGIMVFAAARALGAAHPEKRELFVEHAPEAVERAMLDLGMFMGIGYLCRKVGLEGDEGDDAMMGLFK